MSKPVAIIISDIHYNINTLPLADSALRMAIYESNEIEVPLVVAGDLHDTKANLRAECINAMIKTFSLARQHVYVIRGNHDQIHEKSKDHALEFLREHVNAIVEIPRVFRELGKINGQHITLIPYHSEPDELREHLKTIPEGSTIIMHQGLTGTNSGDYIQDKSAITHEDVANFRVISGHYHTRQDIKTGRPRQGAVGLFSYIGNPYTLGFGEAADPTKGYQILMDDGSLKFVRTRLRKHVIFNVELYKGNFQITGKGPIEDVEENDLVLVKLTGTKEYLSTINKDKFLASCDFPLNSRLDLIAEQTDAAEQHIKNDMSQSEVLDSIIENLKGASEEQKARLKELWRTAVCG